jgi:TetR/AcrR family tetracycline transcriptional repressor
MKKRNATATKPRPTLTRERIVDAALGVMDAEGVDALSMRRVAREVGVEAMSLYNHVRDKEDLLDGMVERIMASMPEPAEPADDDWFGYGRQIAMHWRAMLTSHPGAIQLLAERKAPIHTLEALRPADRALGALMRAGLSPEDAVQAFHTIGGYIFGYVMMETGQLFGDQPGHDVPADVEPLLPSLALTAPYLHDCDFDAQFAFGLDLMFEGLRSKVGAS